MRAFFELVGSDQSLKFKVVSAQLVACFAGTSIYKFGLPHLPNLDDTTLGRMTHLKNIKP
jgi:hypothetical protein